MAKPNRLLRMVTKLNTSPLPVPVKQAALTLLFNSQVKIAFTCGLKVQEINDKRVHLRLNNNMRVQNHIGGVHACGMALLAECASGIVFGMNVPDTSVALLKSMNVRFKKRAQGDLQAVASLTPQQIDDILSNEKGEVLVDVKVTDSTGESPIECEMLCAWIPKKRKLAEEMELMSKEVQIVRHERLKRYCESCCEEWDQELRARGLAIIRDRD